MDKIGFKNVSLEFMLQHLVDEITKGVEPIISDFLQSPPTSPPKSSKKSKLNHIVPIKQNTPNGCIFSSKKQQEYVTYNIIHSKYVIYDIISPFTILK